MDEIPKIPEFYARKKLLITGVTGFIGQVLLWKLLHSCPLLDTIFILLRNKHGKDVSCRLNELLNHSIFNDFIQNDPAILKKVVPISGDLAEPGLGLSTNDRELLIKEVSIIFHNAANLKMDADLKTSAKINTESVIYMLDMAVNMPKLKSFVYVSTAYSCCHSPLVKEQLYKMKENPLDIINMIRLLPTDLLDQITPKLISPSPNTYVYTKRLTEILLADYKSKLPVVIARPTIVTPSAKEPVPGFVSSMNGMIGLTIAIGSGIVRSVLLDPDKTVNIIPVDIVCNGLVAIPWMESQKICSPDSDITVYNLAQADCELLTWGGYDKILHDIVIRAAPLDAMLWYPSANPFHTNKIIFSINVMLFHTIPAYLIDFILLLLGRKRFMIRIQQKVSQRQAVLSYFTRNEWDFVIENLMQIKKAMNAADRKLFPVTMEHVNVESLVIKASLGVKRFILHEDVNNLAKCRQKLWTLFILDKIVKFTFVVILAKQFLRILQRIFNDFVAN